jgi:hypothetical protein
MLEVGRLEIELLEIELLEIGLLEIELLEVGLLEVGNVGTRVISPPPNRNLNYLTLISARKALPNGLGTQPSRLARFACIGLL